MGEVMTSKEWAEISLIKAEWGLGSDQGLLTLDLAQKRILELLAIVDKQTEENFKLKILADNQENQITNLRAGISI